MICDSNFTHFVPVSPGDLMKKVKSFSSRYQKNLRKKRQNERDIQDKSFFYCKKCLVTSITSQPINYFPQLTNTSYAELKQRNNRKENDKRKKNHTILKCLKKCYKQLLDTFNNFFEEMKCNMSKSWAWFFHLFKHFYIYRTRSGKLNDFCMMESLTGMGSKPRIVWVCLSIL